MTHQHTYRRLHAAANLYHPTRFGPVDLIVIHDGEGDMRRVHDPTYQPAAAGYARYFASGRAGGSAHVCVDDHEVWRCVDDHETAFGAKRHNANGLHIELAGFAAWTGEEWLRHMPTLREAARIVAGWHATHNIPFREATPGVDGRMRGGYHAHRGLPGNDHTDPGSGFPWSTFLALVRRHLHPIIEPPTRGDTLQLVLTPPGGVRRVWRGWEEAFPAIQWVARNGLRSGTTGALAWSGAVWRDPTDIVNVAKHLARRYRKEKAA